MCQTPLCAIVSTILNSLLLCDVLLVCADCVPPVAKLCRVWLQGIEACKVHSKTSDWLRPWLTSRSWIQGNGLALQREVHVNLVLSHRPQIILHPLAVHPTHLHLSACSNPFDIERPSPCTFWAVSSYSVEPAATSRYLVFSIQDGWQKHGKHSPEMYSSARQSILSLQIAWNVDNCGGLKAPKAENERSRSEVHNRQTKTV
jgi:hypothetical protein